MDFNEDWEAWRNVMPGARKTVMVTGTCRFPTSGYSITLREGQGGINPLMLSLDLIVHEPTGVVQEVLTDERATFFADAPIEYSQVEIKPGGPVLKVQLAH